MQEKKFNKGEVIIRQGDYGESFFQIVEGSVDVYVDYQGANEKKLRELGAGEYFGEMAVLEAYPRSATVVASADGTTVKEISEKEINTYFQEEPEKIIELFRHVSQCLRTLTADYKEAEDVLEQLGGEEKEDEGFFAKVGKALSNLFSGHSGQISAETLRALGEADYSKGYSKDTDSYKAGTVIFKEGEPGRCLYAIHWGRVGIYADYGTPEQKLLTELAAGQFFGEMGMIENEPRSATAVVIDNDTVLEIIRPEDLAELFDKNPLKVDMILQNLSYRLRRLTNEYADICAKVKEKQKA